MELDIKPEQVNDLIATAILKSKIGELIQKEVEGWVEGVIANEVRDVVSKILKEDYAEQIKAAVKEKLGHKLSEDFMGELVDTTLEKLYYSRY